MVGLWSLVRIVHVLSAALRLDGPLTDKGPAPGCRYGALAMHHPGAIAVFDSATA